MDSTSDDSDEAEELNHSAPAGMESCEGSRETSTTLDVSQRDLDETLHEAIQKKDPLTLKGQINVGGTMSITNNHYHDHRVIHKHVQRQHGDIHQVTNKFLEKGDTVQHINYNISAGGCKTHLEGQSRAEMASTRDVFVVTQSYRKALQQLSEEGLLIITGPPGTGKSSVAHALLRHYTEHDYTPLIIKSYEEWRQNVGGEDKQIMLLDHVLGREDLDRSCFLKWMESFQTLQAFIHDNMCLVIVTVNEQVLAEVVAECAYGEFLKKILIMSTTQPFSDYEKLEMLQKHLSEKRKLLQQVDTDDILHKDVSGPFFPLICREYANLCDTDANPGDFFLEKGQELKRCYRPKSTPLHAACYNGDIKIVSALLLEGVDTEILDSSGNTALHVASYQGYTSIIEQLCTKGSFINLKIKNDSGQNPLSLACETGQSSTVQVLLEYGADVNEPPRIESPLHIACKLGHFEIVKTLLEHKANLNHANPKGQTPLHCLLEDRQKFQEQNRNEIFKLLLREGADILCCDDYSATPLDVVLTYSQNEFLQKIVLFHMAEQDIKTITGSSAIHLACQCCSEAVVLSLLQRKFLSVSLDVRDFTGSTPLHDAVKSQNVFRIKIVRLLLEHGADIDAVDHHGVSPFNELIIQDSELLDLFLKHGVSLNRTDFSGNSLLHLAIKNRTDKYGLLRLISYGIDFKCKNLEGDTPLHVACAVGDADAVKMLLDIGCDPDLLNKAGESPQDIAYNYHHATLLPLFMYSQMNLWHCKDKTNSLRKKNVYLEVLDSAKNVDSVHYQGNCTESDTVSGKTLARPESEILLNRQIKQSSDCLQDPQASKEEGGTVSNHGDETDHNNYIMNLNDRPENSDFDAHEYYICDLQAHTVHKIHSANDKMLLHAACKRNDFTLAKAVLLEDIDINLPDEEGKTPMHYVAAHGSSFMIDILLQHGSKVNVVDNSGQSPLHLACGNNHAPVTAVLLSHGADGNAADCEGETPLHKACRNGCSGTAAVLITKGVNVNHTNNKGDTALHVAAQNGHTEVSLVLLHSGSDFTTINKQRKTALSLAVSGHHIPLIDLLERHTLFDRKAERHSHQVCWMQFLWMPVVAVFILSWLSSIFL